MLLAGLGALLAGWAASLWRKGGFAPSKGAFRVAAAAVAFLSAFEAAAAFSSGDGVDPFTASQLFFAIMARHARHAAHIHTRACG